MVSAPDGPTKPQIRRRCRAYRASLTEAAHRARSMRLVTHAQALPVLQQARCVLAYWPLLQRREVDTRPLIDWLLARGCRVALPVVQPRSSGQPPQMEARHYEGQTRLRPNTWGIGEPTGGELVPKGDLDAVVVPALAADSLGTRLGTGQGYYDAFLQGCALPRIGLLYAACFLDFIPADPHDVPLTHIVTEEGQRHVQLPSDA
ncbi:MAG: 5-formyltetrahydrofolate cyclo-ligase [Bacteroidota bacterium]